MKTTIGHYSVWKPGCRGFIFVCLMVSGPFWASPATAATGKSVSATAQERVTELIQNVLGAYRGEGALTSGSTNSASITYTNIEASFREASMLMPDRLDLRLGIASALIGQALQTNSQFDVKMKNALTVYQEIQAMDTNGFQAGILYAAYNRAIGESNAAALTSAHLVAVYPERTRAYLKKFQRIDETLQIAPTEKFEKVTPLGREHAIVILGAMLETNGTIKPKLLGRLQQGLALARTYPESPIIVTGGNPRSGITEAYVMSRWLMNEGISTNRLHLEDRSTDTVGNAVRSCTILDKLGVTHVTLVTSASHMRRALADFEEAALDRGLQLKFFHLAASEDVKIDEGRERVAIYRDVMRTSGIWAFPGIQR